MSERISVTPVWSQARRAALVEELWPLYVSTGERNGLVILSKRKFTAFHVENPSLEVVLSREPSSGRLLGFCTGVRFRDTLLPQWVGVDYENPLTMKASVYYNVIYAHIGAAIEDPAVRCVDIGACHRQAKMSMGFQPVPVSLYIKCGKAMAPLLQAGMQAFFNPKSLMVDP